MAQESLVATVRILFKDMDPYEVADVVKQLFEEQDQLRLALGSVPPEVDRYSHIRDELSDAIADMDYEDDEDDEDYEDDDELEDSPDVRLP